VSTATIFRLVDEKNLASSTPDRILIDSGVDSRRTKFANAANGYGLKRSYFSASKATVGRISGVNVDSRFVPNPRRRNTVEKHLNRTRFNRLTAPGQLRDGVKTLETRLTFFENTSRIDRLLAFRFLTASALHIYIYRRYYKSRMGCARANRSIVSKQLSLFRRRYLGHTRPPRRGDSNSGFPLPFVAAAINTFRGFPPRSYS